METITKHKKKRYGWLLFFTAINWLVIAYVVFWVDPETIKDFIFPDSYLPMVLLMAGGVFWVLSILFLSAARALRWTLGITTFLLLRLLGLGTTMNGVLILGLLISWEVYIVKTK
jgi:hypothetical protein